MLKISLASVDKFASLAWKGRKNFQSLWF